MSDFKPGDVVELKDGSQRMTVRGTSQMMGGMAGTDLVCDWIDSKGHLKSGTFDPDQLRIFKPRQPPRAIRS